MRLKGRRWFLFIACMYVYGCAAAQPHSTRLQLGDLNEVSDRMARSLASSAWLVSRTAQSERAVVTLQKVVNLTTDLIPPAEQWMIMDRIRSALSISELAHKRNLVFQIPPQKQAWLYAHGKLKQRSPTLKATHVLSATFRSARRNDRRTPGGQVRATKDYYDLAFEIRQVASRQIVWSDHFELARRAVGLRID